MNGRGARALLLAALCVTAVVGGPASATARGIPAQTATDGTIVRTATLSLTPGEPGEIGVVARYDVPDSVTELSVELPAGTTDVRTDGFVATASGYEWTGESDPAIAFTQTVNRTTASVDGGAAARPGTEGLAFADAGPWAIAPVLTFATKWRGDPGVTLERETRTDGPGVVGNAMAYLGPAERFNREVAGQNLTLVVPAGASLEAEPAAVLDALASAAELRVGERDERVVMIAAPVGVGWGPTGLQYGDNTAWVRADQRIDDPAATWFHEYVHTRQAFETTPATRWFVEGSARYYAARLALTNDFVSFAAFQRTLARGEEATYADTVLAEPSTWTEGAQYAKGALVAGELDRRIRMRTNGTATLDSVFARMNAHEGPLTGAEFRDAVAAVSPPVRDAARRYTETTATPTMWDAAAHRAAFGMEAPRFVYDPVSGGAFEVHGPYRNATYDALPPVVVGERLAVEVAVENVGAASGTYNATLTAGGRVLDAATGELGAGQRRTVTLAGRLSTPGVDLRVGTSVVGSVRQPADPRVTDLRVGEPAANGTYPVRATVAAPADLPAGDTLPLTVNGTVAARRHVTLGPGETAELRASLALDAGTSRVVLGERAVRVRVPESAGEEAGVPTPGVPLGPAPAVIAVLVVATLRRWWR